MYNRKLNASPYTVDISSLNPGSRPFFPITVNNPFTATKAANKKKIK